MYITRTTSHFRSKAKFLNFEDKWNCLSCCHIGWSSRSIQSVSLTRDKKHFNYHLFAATITQCPCQIPVSPLEWLKIWGASKLIMVVIPVISVALRHKTRRMSIIMHSFVYDVYVLHSHSFTVRYICIWHHSTRQHTTAFQEYQY